jgi:hypothetical protein
MGSIFARDQSGGVIGLSDIPSVGQAEAQGWTLLRPDLTPYNVTPFMGGTLLDYLPMNIYLFGVWYTGQQEALAASWANGSLPKPPANILALPVVPIPPAGAAAPATDLISSITSLPWYVLALGGYVLYRML